MDAHVSNYIKEKTELIREISALTTKLQEETAEHLEEKSQLTAKVQQLQAELEAKSQLAAQHLEESAKNEAKVSELQAKMEEKVQLAAKRLEESAKNGAKVVELEAKVAGLRIQMGMLLVILKQWGSVIGTPETFEIYTDFLKIRFQMVWLSKGLAIQ